MKYSAALSRLLFPSASQKHPSPLSRNVSLLPAGCAETTAGGAAQLNTALFGSRRKMCVLNGGARPFIFLFFCNWYQKYIDVTSILYYNIRACCIYSQSFFLRCKRVFRNEWGTFGIPLSTLIGEKIGKIKFKKSATWKILCEIIACCNGSCAIMFPLSRALKKKLETNPRCDTKWIRCACCVRLWMSLKSCSFNLLFPFFGSTSRVWKTPPPPPPTPPRCQLHSHVRRVALDELRKCLIEGPPKIENHRLKPETLVVDLNTSLLCCRAFVVSNFIIPRDLNKVCSPGVRWLV